VNGFEQRNLTLKDQGPDQASPAQNLSDPNLEPPGSDVRRARLARILRFGAALILVIVVSSSLSYWRAFGNIAPYDDEGNLILSLRQFHAGGILYDKVVSIYGPVFYIYESIPRLFNGGLMSHDSVRVVTAILRVATGLVIFLLVYRGTRSLLWALLVQFAGFRGLGFMGGETAHPQEICILLLLAVPLVASMCRPVVATAWFGALAALLTLSKINAGIFATAAIALVVTMALPRGLLQRLLSAATVLGALALPFALMKDHLNQTSTFCYALLVFLSLVAALVGLRTNRLEQIRWRDVGVGLLAGAALAVTVMSFVMVRGTSISGMIQSLIILPGTRFVQGLSQPLPVEPLAVVWAVVNVVLAWLAFRGRLSATFLAVLKLLLGVAVFVCVETEHPAQCIALGCPMLWLVTVGARREFVESTLFRPMLALLAVIQTLYAYPVAGRQTAFVSVLMLVTAALCVWDALPLLEAMLPARLSHLVPAAAVASVLILNLGSVYFGSRQFYSREPLGLPGARHLRLEPELTATLRRLYAESQACSMLATLPGLPSFNLFSGKPMPPGLSAGPWMLGMDDAAQTTVVQEMRAQPSPCAIYCPGAAGIWLRGVEPPSGPLVRYIRNDLQVRFAADGYQFLVKRQ
jgi:hypothetical protein